MFRILFVIIAAAVITFGTIIFGIYLQKKIDAAEVLSNISEPADELIIGKSHIKETDSMKRAVFASGINLADYSDEESVVAAVNEISSQYNTIIIRTADKNGNLIYTSPAVCEALRIVSPHDDISLKLLRSAVSAAKSHKLYICVMLESSYGKLADGIDSMIDGIIANELASFGADEVLFSGLITQSENIGGDKIAEYTHCCKSVTDGSCAVGIVIPEDVYLNFKNAKGIQTVSSSADFTAIDMTYSGECDPMVAYEDTSEEITSLFGSFSVYNMRVLLSTIDKSILSAQYHALTDNNIMNICFTELIDEASLTFTEKPLTAYEVSDDETQEQEITKSYQSDVNPYATTKQDEQQEENNGDEDSDEGYGGWY